MSQTFLLPDLGEGLTEAEVVAWLVAEGDEVAIDQPIAEVETAKSIVEVPSPFAGTVAKLHAAEGETVEVGKPLITIDAVGAATSSVTSPGESPEPAQADAERYREEEKAGSGNVLIGYGTSGERSSGRRRRAKVPSSASVKAAEPVISVSRRVAAPLVTSPLVRKLARDAGVDLQSISGSGDGGLITRADIERTVVSAENHANGVVEAPVSGAGEPVVGEHRIALSGFRKAATEALSRSRAEIPEATVWVDVDATALWELRESARCASDAGPGLIAYMARFVIAGLRAYPVLNARFDAKNDEIVQYDQINLGLAVQGERGLVVPAVMNAGTMTAAGLDAAIRELTARARVGKATTEELTAGTFTLNNYGSFRVDGSAPIINHPQVAMLGFGRIIDKPWVVEGELAIRKMTQMSFVFDHRVCDGGTAAGFMRLVADAIETPASVIAQL